MVRRIEISFRRALPTTQECEHIGGALTVRFRINWNLVFGALSQIIFSGELHSNADQWIA